MNLRRFSLLLLVSSIGWAAPYDALTVCANWAIRLYQLTLSPLQGRICNFTPSCSEYARQSYLRYGFVRGTLATSDRLERCNPFAWTYVGRYYSGTSGDRVLDPVTAGPTPGPSLPSGPAVPRVVSPDSDIAFADHLYLREEYGPAFGEYERGYFARLEEDGSVPASDTASAMGRREWCAYCRLMAGQCKLDLGANEEALRIFQQADTVIPEQKLLWRYKAGQAYFQNGNYVPARMTFAALGTLAWSLAKSSRFLSAWSCYRAGDFRVGAQMMASYPDSAARRLAALDGRGLPRRSAALAGAMSTLIPGLGQTYAGRWGDGLYSFLVNAACAATAYYYLRNHENWPAGIFAGFTLLFWAGNVYGATRAANSYNAYQKQAYGAYADSLFQRLKIDPANPLVEWHYSP